MKNENDPDIKVRDPYERSINEFESPNKKDGPSVSSKGSSKGKISRNQVAEEFREWYFLR